MEQKMRGLYLISNDEPIESLLAKLQAALATGQIALFQYRRKKLAKREQSAEIGQVLDLCERYAVPLVINNDLEQAQQFGLHIHLGPSDASIAEARAALGNSAIIGCNSLASSEVALAQQQAGANYLALGAIYPSATKPEAKTISLDVVRSVRQQCHLPISAVGGLRVENAAEVIAAGAQLCAVVSDILDLSPAAIPARVAQWQQLFSQP
jgi:thiamine-phosphate pyrophosphorylase